MRGAPVCTVRDRDLPSDLYSASSYNLRSRPTMVAPLYTTESGLLFHAGKILVLTVGLPARGKTHISRALERYLRWTGVKIMVVSLGDYRRKILGSAGKLPSDYFTLGASDFLCYLYPKSV